MAIKQLNIFQLAGENLSCFLGKFVFVPKLREVFRFVTFPGSQHYIRSMKLSENKLAMPDHPSPFFVRRKRIARFLFLQIKRLRKARIAY